MTQNQPETSQLPEKSIFKEKKEKFAMQLPLVGSAAINIMDKKGASIRQFKKY